jgi:hypothetical protein
MLLTIGTTAKLLLTVGKIEELFRIVVLGALLVSLLGLLGGGGGVGVLVDVELRMMSELVVGMILTLLVVVCVGCCCVVLVVAGRVDCSLVVAG